MWSPPRLTVSTAASLPSRKPNAAKARVAGSPRVTQWSTPCARPGDLQLEVALIAPEPGRANRRARACRRGGGRRIWPDRSRSARIRAGAARRSPRAESGAIADRGNGGIGGDELARRRRTPSAQSSPASSASASSAVTPTPTMTRSAGSRRPSDKLHRRDAPVLAMQRRDAVAEFEAARRTPCARRGRTPTSTGEIARPIGRSAISTTVTSAPERQRRRGDLQADEAGADHHDARAAASAALIAAASRIARKRVDAFEVEPGRAQHAGAGAGGEDQVIVGLGAAVLQLDASARRGRCARRRRRAGARCAARRRTFRRAAAGRRASIWPLRNALDSGGR